MTPARSATQRDRGRAVTSAGVPRWTTRPRFEHDHPIRERERLQRIVRHQQTHPVERRQVLAEIAPQLRASLDVDGGERLVEQQEPRLDRERARQRDALALSAGERARLRARPVAEAHALEPAARAMRRASPRDRP